MDKKTYLILLPLTLTGAKTVTKSRARPSPDAVAAALAVVASHHRRDRSSGNNAAGLVGQGSSRRADVPQLPPARLSARPC